MITSLSTILKSYKPLFKRSVSKDTSKSKNSQRPSTKTTSNSSSGSKGITISTVETEAKITIQGKEEAIALSIWGSPTKASYPKLTTAEGKWFQKLICPAKR
jgi:hypothetical protein